MHIFTLGLQNDFELLRILNYWSLNNRGSAHFESFRGHLFHTACNCLKFHYHILR